MQLLAQRLVEVQLIEQVSDETVRRGLKKTRLLPLAERAVVYW